MIKQEAVAGHAPAPAGQVALVFETIFSPARAFRALREDPHWLAPLILFTGANFVHTSVSLPYTLKQMASRIESMNPRMAGQALAENTEISNFMVGSVALLSSIIAPLLILLITAGLVHLTAILLRGEMKTTGRTVFALCSYASLPLALSFLVRAPLILSKKTLDISLGLDVLLPGVAWSGGLLEALRFMDLFRLWFIVLLTLAVAVIYQLRWGRALAVSLGVNAVWFLIVVVLTRAWGL